MWTGLNSGTLHELDIFWSKQNMFAWGSISLRKLRITAENVHNITLYWTIKCFLEITWKEEKSHQFENGCKALSRDFKEKELKEFETDDVL